MKQVQDPMGQVFALARDCDSSQLRLTGAQGYLLSRIDGVTPWRLLREMGGIPAAEVDACLTAWVDEGLLETVGPASFDTKSETCTTNAKNAIEAEAANAPHPDQAEPSDTAQATETARLVIEIDESQLDENLDLGIRAQRRILEYEASLGLPYHELLSVPKGSSAKVVKRAYFKLSKEFHPDRYFRKEIGSYGARLDRIFKKVLEAHEMLSDPELCQVENQRDAVSQAAAAKAIPTAAMAPESATESPLAQPRPLTKLERLKQRMPFKIDQAAIEARRVKAQEIFRAAENSQRSGRLTEAEASIRIAISFDPTRAEFKEALGSIRIQQAGARATTLLASPSERMSDGDLREALQLLEDILIYRPHDPELNDRAARVCLQLGKLDLAMEYAETIVARTPDVAACHTLLGRICRERGDLNEAVSSFETALKLDDGNLDARRALASVRIGARDAAQGGTA